MILCYPIALPMAIAIHHEIPFWGCTENADKVISDVAGGREQLALIMKFCVYSYANESEIGPLEAEALIEKLYAGEFQWEDAIREEDSEEWKTMSDVFDLEMLDGRSG